jgi:hypothetical protein
MLIYLFIVLALFAVWLTVGLISVLRTKIALSKLSPEDRAKAIDKINAEAEERHRELEKDSRFWGAQNIAIAASVAITGISWMLSEVTGNPAFDRGIIIGFGLLFVMGFVVIINTLFR